MEYAVTNTDVAQAEGGEYRVYGINVFGNAASGERESVYAFADVSVSEEDVHRLIGRLVKENVPVSHLHYEVMRFIEYGFTE